MKRHNKSHSDHREEHQFGNKKIEKAKNSKYRELHRLLNQELEHQQAERIWRKVQEVLNEAKDVVMQDIEYEVKEKTEENIKENREKKLFWWSVILVLVVLAFLLEYPLKEWGLEMQIISYGFVAEIILVVVGVLLGIPKVNQFRRKDEGVTKGMLIVLRNLLVEMKRMSILHVFALLTGVLIMSAIIAKNDVLAGVSMFVKGGYLAVVDNTEDIFLATGEVSVTEEAQKMLAENDKDLINRLERVSVSENEKNRVLNLSAKDYNIVFFQNEKYSISYTESQEQIDATVLLMVEDYSKVGKENVFDKPYEEGGAPVDVETAISAASKKEETADSFSEFEEILGAREDAYVFYPKKSLANLISNNYQKLALLLVMNGGRKETIVYYYCQSIINSMECLEYADCSDMTIKQKLTSVAQRYQDIVYVYPDFEGADFAEKLAIAFEHAADQY